jgi:hypothetical protein
MKFSIFLCIKDGLFLPRWKTEIRAAAPGVVLFEIQKGKMIIKVCNRGMKNGVNSAGVTLLLRSGAGCFSG